MLKSGTVVSLNHADKTGIIVDAKNKEYFFSITECYEGRLPNVWDEVTFVKDPDFKSTPVAMLIKSTEVMKKLAVG